MIPDRKALLVAATMAALLSACSSSHGPGVAGTPSSTSGATNAPSTSAPGTGSSATSFVAPTSSTSSTAPSVAPPAGPSRCTSGSLTASLTGANGTAGSIYYALVLTNTGPAACLLQGYPGVSFVTGPSGQQVGAPASRIPGSAPTLSVAPGGTAQAVLQVTDASNFGTACRTTKVAGLRVYPPDQTAALYVAHADRACANRADVTLHVGALRAPA